jgi:hypothetical protein
VTQGHGFSARRARLAVSFADLALLLLGFFVLLQASGSRSHAVLSQISTQFGAKPKADAPELRADALFEPGEAMLSDKGKVRISAIAATMAHGSTLIEILSIGQDRGARRFDGWDLAAARLGAVARAMTAGGIDERRLVIRGPDQSADDGAGQRIRIAIATEKR